MSQPLYGAIEGGGTKFICAVASGPERILERTTVATGEPAGTLGECADFFAAAERRHGPIASFGVACFGPIELRAASERFGRMMATPKAGWAGTDVLAPLRERFSVPIALDTDVGAAALAEWRLGAGRDVGSLAYVTVGTGIGGATVPQDPAASRLMHAEMGHVPVRRDVRDRDFAGVCPFHRDCLEGLASGPAILRRWGHTLADLPADHEAHAVVAGYLGQLAASIALVTAVERVVFGGGVVSTGTLVPLIRTAALAYLNGYLEPLNAPDRSAAYVCAPALGNDAGIVGAVLLAVGAHASEPPAR
jgi:fructokinase